MNRVERRGVTGVALIVLALLTGCSTTSQSSRFYLMSPLQETLEQSRMITTQPLLGISSVGLADYLDRPQILVRNGPHRLELNEFDRWAGPLQENLRSVLSRSLEQHFGAEQVIVAPWHDALRPAYELSLQIDQLDATQAGDLTLRGRWTLYAPAGRRLVALGRISLREVIAGADAEAIVAATAVVVARLGDRLAKQISPHLKP